MKSLLKSLIISLSFLMTNSVIAEEAKSVQWLFVHTAETAEMTSETTLSMPVTKEIFAFSDRPNRLHHYLDAHGFAMLWFQGGENAFRVDPPNAVLTWTADGVVKESEITIALANALDDGKRMEYTVQFEQEPLLTNVILSNVSLFVDSNREGCISGCYIKSKYPGYWQGKTACGDEWMPGMVCKMMVKGHMIEKTQLYRVCDPATNINIIGKQCTREEWLISR